MKSFKIYPSISLRKSICFVLLPALAAVMMWRAVDTSAQKDAGALPNGARIERSASFAEFDKWIEDYAAGNFSPASDFIRSGERLAAERRELFRELMRTNPRAAIEKAVSDETRSRLPFEIARFLEKRTGARGDFNVYAIDGENSAAHEIEREFVTGGVRYEAFVYGKKASMTTKLDIALRGVVLDQSMAVDENSVRRLEPSELAARTGGNDKSPKNKIAAEVGESLVYFNDEQEFDAYVGDLDRWESAIEPTRNAASPWSEGQKTLLFIRIDFPDRPGEPTDRFHNPLTESAAQNLIDGPVNQFYVANSYGKTSLRATVTPVVRMPQPQSAYPRENLFGLVTDARNAARAAGFETNNFNLDMVAYGYTELHAFSGISPIANKGALLNGSFTFKVAAHELGHAYGLMHANLWRTFDGTPTGAGSNVEYGDDFDMMGRGAAMESHFNASYKRDLDWLGEENVKTVTENGVYRIFAHDTSEITASVRALKIRKDDGKDYWVEFRQLLTNFPNLMNGALVRWEYPFEGWRQTQVLDMKPETTSLADASILIGETFSDDRSGVRITVLGKGNTTPESLDVRVEFNYSIINGAPFDFDGDAKTDVSIFRPSAGQWWYLRSSDDQNRAFQFGVASDKITAADFTGDGKTDIAFFRPSTGEWFVLRSEDNSYYSFPFGASGDVPVAEDFDADGRADAGVFRPSNVTWYINKSSGGTIIRQFGASGDVPVAADYDGDGRADIAVFRPSAGEWWINKSLDNSVVAFQFGSAADKPVPADYTGDGKTDVAFWRPANGYWYVLRSEDSSFYAAPFGLTGDVPAAGDYDGDGRADFAVFRPADANWYLSRSQSGFTTVQFGASGDTPVPARVNP